MRVTQQDREARTVTDAIIISVIVGYLDDVALRLGHHVVPLVVERLRERFGVLAERAERRMGARKRRRR
jgi:hypothetical protein